MKCVALVSGGKDSCHAMALAETNGGHEVVALANLLPQEDAPDELDSYMYQTVGHQLVGSYTSCMGVPLFRHRIRGSSKHQDLQYTQTLGDEVEDLSLLLAYVKATLPCVTAVSSGAIASDYQRLRVEHVCARLGLVSLAYMWHMPQRSLLRGMIDSQLHAIFVKVAALGLEPHKHLGKSIAQLHHTLHRLNCLYGSNVCGEGGEYETLTLDCPAFKLGRIVLDEFEVVICSEGSIAQVGYLHPTKFHVEPKQSEQTAVIAQPDLRQGIVHMVPCDWSPSLPSTDLPCEPPSLRASSTEVRYNVVLQSPALCGRGEYTQISGWAVERDSAQPGSDISAGNSRLALTAVLQALVHALAEEGLGLCHAIFVHQHVCNMAHFGDVNAVYSQFFPAADPPSRACVQLPLPDGVPVSVSVLLARHAYLGHRPSPATLPPSQQNPPPTAPGSCPDNTAASPPAAAAPAAAGGSDGHTAFAAGRMAKGEGELIGVQGQTESSAQSGRERRVLHVQSISSWAPSCIGPYSQANTFRGITHIAGAIPLYPDTMAVLSPEPHLQTLLAAANAQAVAIATGSCIHNACLSSIVYLSSAADVDAKEAIKRVMCDIHKAGLPPAHKLHDFFGKVASGRVSHPPADAVAALLGQQRAGCEGESEEEEEEGQPDPYLCPPQTPEVMPGHLVFVEVPALPRSCLVEVQPTVLDVRWLQAKVDSRLQSSSSSSSSSSSDDDDDDDDDDEQQDPSQPTSREGKQEAGMQVSSSIQRDGTHHDQQQQHHHHHHQCGRRSQELGSVSTVERIDASVPGSSASVVCLSSRSLYQGAAITLLLGIKPDAFNEVDFMPLLRHEVLVALDQHSAGLHHIVQIRAWYDSTQVCALRPAVELGVHRIV
uniref:Diphthine--ammonia ligase n=1 Tax=Dunaliella tertiolecta TaxID=3047 RepID=A0A7S3VQ90_DUNTE